MSACGALRSVPTYPLRNVPCSAFANCEYTEGMLKPQDILVVLKVASLAGAPWTYKSLAESLGISAASAHESVARAVAAGLLNGRERRAMRAAVEEFLIHGLRYMLPAERGRLARGITTSVSAPAFHGRLTSQDVPTVWAYPKGDVRGETLAPIHEAAPEAATKDARLYALLAAADALRSGGAREREAATAVLKEVLAS